MMPQTRDAVCETLFVLCNKDGKYVNRERECVCVCEREREKERNQIIR